MILLSFFWCLCKYGTVCSEESLPSCTLSYGTLYSIGVRKLNEIIPVNYGENDKKIISVIKYKKMWSLLAEWLGGKLNEESIDCPKISQTQFRIFSTFHLFLPFNWSELVKPKYWRMTSVMRPTLLVYFIQCIGFQCFSFFKFF
jgi:hypothetical protein